MVYTSSVSCGCLLHLTRPRGPQGGLGANAAWGLKAKLCFVPVETGKHGSTCADVTNASRTFMMDLGTCQWSPALMSQFGATQVGCHVDVPTAARYSCRKRDHGSFAGHAAEDRKQQRASRQYPGRRLGRSASGGHPR